MGNVLAKIPKSNETERGGSLRPKACEGQQSPVKQVHWRAHRGQTKRFDEARAADRSCPAVLTNELEQTNSDRGAVVTRPCGSTRRHQLAASGAREAATAA